MGHQTRSAGGTQDRAKSQLPVAFEELGVDRIPEEKRRATPWTFFAVCNGASQNLGSVVFGWLPITFGLGLQAAVTSIVVGTLIGLIPMAPLLLIGSRAATNNPTASGGAFGVRGRLIGSALGLTLMLVFTALAIWVGGGVLVSASARLLHTPAGTGALVFSYVALTVASIVIAFWGFHLLVAVTRWLMVFGLVTILAMPFAFGGHLHLGYAGGHYALGSLTATWVLSVLAVGVGQVMAMATVMGDWTRYVSSDRHPPRRLLPVALLAVAVSFIVPEGIGAVVTTAFRNPGGSSFAASLVAASPGWYAWVLVLMALVGGLGWSASSIYSAGLDLDAILGRRERAQATVVASVASVALVLTGLLAWDASGSLTAITLILLAVSAPWAAVIGVDYLRRRGQYDADDLQVFNRRQRGGDYWYAAGWNLRAVAAWAIGCAFGLLTVQTTLVTGPWARIVGGTGAGFAIAFIVAGALYAVLEAIAARGAASRTVASMSARRA
jgi:purine-cytosine permease-like protein